MSLSLSPKDLIAAVMLENEVLLYAFFTVFAAVMAHAFAHDLFVSVASQNLRFDEDFLQVTVCAFLQPQQKSWG